MSIRIEILADSVPELVSALQQMTANLSGATSANALDTARQITDADTASSGDLGDDAAECSVKRRGRPPKAKVVTSPEPASAEPDEAHPLKAILDTRDVDDYVSKITELYRNGDDETRKRIRKWRDDMGFGALKDMTLDHVWEARGLLKDLGVSLL